MAEHNDGEAASGDVEDRRDDAAQGHPRNAANAVAGRAAIGDAGADADKKPRDTDKCEVATDVRIGRSGDQGDGSGDQDEPRDESGAFTRHSGI